MTHSGVLVLSLMTFAIFLVMVKAYRIDTTFVYEAKYTRPRPSYSEADAAII